MQNSNNIDSNIQWAIDALYSKGHQVHSSIPDIIQDNPWLVVYRLKTDQGFVFLKKVPAALSLEPKIINLLFDKFHANVPHLIAINHD
jgi:hypothetical protein